MRTVKQGWASVNELVDIAEAQLLSVVNGDIDTSNYARYDFLHSGLLVFSNVFLDVEDSRSELLYIGGYEKDSTLFMPDFTLYLFNTCDIAPVKNDAFSFSAETMIEDAIAVIDVPAGSWKVCRSGGTDTDARLKHGVTTPDVLVPAVGSRDLYGIAVFNSDTGEAFQTGASLKLWLGIKHS